MVILFKLHSILSGFFRFVTLLVKCFNLKKSGPSLFPRTGLKTKKAYPKTSLDNLILEIRVSLRQLRLSIYYLGRDRAMVNDLVYNGLSYAHFIKKVIHRQSFNL